MIHHLRIKIESRKAVGEILDIGVWKIGSSELLKNIKVPVGKRTITRHSHNHPQKKPGAANEAKCNEIPAPGLLPYPPGETENDDAGMKNNKEDIEDMPDHF
jgi:hypothetical protein